MNIVTIAGYKFSPLANLPALKACFLNKCLELNLKGTILLSTEGINISLAGHFSGIVEFQAFLQQQQDFADIIFHQADSAIEPFRLLKVKIKKEIITMRGQSLHPEQTRAQDISPQQFKAWLDEGRDITVLDTRNHYEVEFGTFKNAINPQISNFSQFEKMTGMLNKSKPLVMFCTGGIRCEKAALYLMENGFENVYQLQRGILNYFKQVGNAHYQGECFVFDARVAVNAELTVSGTQQCKSCQGPIWLNRAHECSLTPL